MVTANVIGRAGEFFAAYVLEMHGVECHHVDRAAADLWCRVGGLVRTVQVKTASEAKPSRVTDNDYRYRYFTPKGKATADWYCFVALDKGVVLLKPASFIAKGTTIFSGREFSAVSQARTIEAFKETC